MTLPLRATSPASQMRTAAYELADRFASPGPLLRPNIHALVQAFAETYRDTECDCALLAHLIRSMQRDLTSSTLFDRPFYANQITRAADRL